jgi:hypothetical protein
MPAPNDNIVTDASIIGLYNGFIRIRFPDDAFVLISLRIFHIATGVHTDLEFLERTPVHSQQIKYNLLILLAGDGDVEHPQSVESEDTCMEDALSVIDGETFNRESRKILT